jgi:putative tricarboxylic transport membrane protein
MKTTNRYQIIPVFFWIGLGLFVMTCSYQLGLGGLHNPGPGLMPFLLGCVLCLVSFYLLVVFLRRKEGGDGTTKGKGERVNTGKLCLVLACLLAYSLLLERLGFLITTLFILIILFRSMNKRWTSVLVASLLTVFVSYFVFTYLGIRFPKGILKGL